MLHIRELNDGMQQKGLRRNDAAIKNQMPVS